MSTTPKMTSLGLPIPRHRQLALLAAHRGVGLADLLGEFVNAAIEAGEIPDVVPGIEVSAIVQDATGLPIVAMQVNDYQSVMTPPIARQLADALDDPNRGKLLLSTIIENTNVVGSDVLRVRGRGPAIVIESQRGGVVTTSTSLARDLARQLRRCADQVDEMNVAQPQPTITKVQNPNGSTTTFVDLDSIV